MKSDDLTHKLPQGNESNDSMDTQPTIETVLERINALGGRIDEFQTKVETELSALRAEVSKLQTDMGKGFRRLERFDGVLGDQMRKMEVDHRDLVDRVDLIESKLP